MMYTQMTLNDLKLIRFTACKSMISESRQDRAGVVRVGIRDLYLIPPSKAEDTNAMLGTSFLKEVDIENAFENASYYQHVQQHFLYTSSSQ